MTAVPVEAYPSMTIKDLEWRALMVQISLDQTTDTREKYELRREAARLRLELRRRGVKLS